MLFILVLQLIEYIPLQQGLRQSQHRQKPLRRPH